jgi:hypothetical protein
VLPCSPPPTGKPTCRFCLETASWWERRLRSERLGQKCGAINRQLKQPDVVRQLSRMRQSQLNGPRDSSFQRGGAARQSWPAIVIENAQDSGAALLTTEQQLNQRAKSGNDDKQFDEREAFLPTRFLLVIGRQPTITACGTSSIIARPGPSRLAGYSEDNRSCFAEHSSEHVVCWTWRVLTRNRAV